MNDTPLAWKYAILGTMYGFTVFTTALLNWYTKPYVHRLKYHAATGQVEASPASWLEKEPRPLPWGSSPVCFLLTSQAQVMDFWTRRLWLSFQLDEVEPSASMHPFAQFRAKGKELQVRRGHPWADPAAC